MTTPFSGYRTFRVRKRIFLTFLSPQDQYNLIVDPTEDNRLQFDGDTVYLVNSQGRHESINTGRVIEVFLADAAIEEIP